MNKAGIIGYGVSIPHYRIKTTEIARVWGKDGEHIAAGLGVKEKAVGSFDEDSATIAVEASRRAVKMAGIDAQKIGAIYIGSESKPYAVKPTAATVADALMAGPDLMAADYEFACKAGTAGIQTCMGLVKSNMIDVGLAVGADTAQGLPGDALEFSAASGGAAFLIGREKCIADINHTYSFTTDTPDFWRRQHEEFPMHAGRFTGDPAYFKHVVSAAKKMLEIAKTKPSDYAHVVFHQPNGKFPVRVGQMLGFSKEQVQTGLITPVIGNTYSGASMIGLAAVLDIAKSGDRILCVSYGSGAGSDAFDLTVTSEISKHKPVAKVQDLVADKEYIDYAVYVKHRRKLKSL
ncbi:hydroxymethylglutaryl-CoA synthase [Candidatus Micrarchaeota archaeon]|nr:hydroxymethylglutaryl-CoA synthase [Candidatus Micrarchaeota archaeon]